MFVKSIRKILEANHLPMLAFAVKRAFRPPTPTPKDPEGREHAAVIIGYDPHNDQATLGHWGGTLLCHSETYFLKQSAS